MDEKELMKPSEEGIDMVEVLTTANEELKAQNETFKKEREILLKQIENGIIASKALEVANLTISNIANSLEIYKNCLEALMKGDK